MDSVMVGTILQALRNTEEEDPILVLSQDLYESTKYMVWSVPMRVNPTLKPSTFYIISGKE